MAVRNPAWYNSNQSRAYPVDDSASSQDDAGARLPQDIVVDAHIRFPSAAGERAFLSAVTVSEQLVTVVLLAADSPLAASGFVPLAAVTAQRPVEQGIHYPVSPLYPGTGGWIVFGSGADSDRPYEGRFSTPQQALLAPRAAQRYIEAPVPDLAVVGDSSPLTGLVTLLGGNDIEVVKECREVPDNPPAGWNLCDELQTQSRDVIVIRLRDTRQVGAERNVFDVYKGQCGLRPESDNCGEPTPIQFLGPVAPDCCGNITITFKGCAELTAITEQALLDEFGDPVEVDSACGVIVDCDIGLDEACVTQDHLPDLEGNLPIDYEDLCESQSVPEVSLSSAEEEELEESLNVDEDEEVSASDMSLPVEDDFESDTFWTTKAGALEYINVSESGDQVLATSFDLGAAVRNLAVYDVDYDTYYRKSIIETELRPGPDGSLHNASLVFNFREFGSTFEFWQAEIDWDGHYHGYKLFRLAFYNGLRSRTEQLVAVPDLALEHKYQISATIYPQANPDHAWLEARLLGIDDPSIDVSIGPLSVANFAPDDGRFGVAANRAVTRFHLFRIENTADLP